MIYNIIGDIHGRTCWKYLVQEEAINVFVGDYFSPYHEISWEEQKQNFLDIINYKTTHPQTILLIGNHDEDHWHLMRSGCCRHDYEHDDEIRQMFEEFADYFQVAYSIENKVLVTHAGVSYVWYDRYKNRVSSTQDINSNDPDKIANVINNLWKEGIYEAFDFAPNATGDDHYGNSQTHGPMWIRTKALEASNIFSSTSYVQVFGHTISSEIHLLGGDRNLLIMVDCLERKADSLIIDTITNTIKTLNEYKHGQ